MFFCEKSNMDLFNLNENVYISVNNQSRFIFNNNF